MKAPDNVRRIAQALARVGAPATLTDENGEATFVACVQPVRRLQNEEFGPLGVNRRRMAVLYAPWGEVSARLKGDSRILWQGQSYRVLQVETLCMAGAPMYVWGMLEQEKEVTQWT